jgi:hypothetical protein
VFTERVRAEDAKLGLHGFGSTTASAVRGGGGGGGEIAAGPGPAPLAISHQQQQQHWGSGVAAPGPGAGGPTGAAGGGPATNAGLLTLLAPSEGAAEREAGKGGRQPALVAVNEWGMTLGRLEGLGLWVRVSLTLTPWGMTLMKTPQIPRWQIHCAVYLFLRQHVHKHGDCICPCPKGRLQPFCSALYELCCWATGSPLLPT